MTKWKEEFEDEFYEGEHNSVKCRKHKTYATPFEFQNFILNLIEEVIDDIPLNFNKYDYQLNAAINGWLYELKQSLKDKYLK